MAAHDGLIPFHKFAAGVAVLWGCRERENVRYDGFIICGITAGNMAEAPWSMSIWVARAEIFSEKLWETHLLPRRLRNQRNRHWFQGHRDRWESASSGLSTRMKAIRSEEDEQAAAEITSVDQRGAGKAGGKLPIEKLNEGACLGDGVYRTLGLGVAVGGLADEGEQGDHKDGGDRHRHQQLDH